MVKKKGKDHTLSRLAPPHRLITERMIKSSKDDLKKKMGGKKKKV